MNAPTRTGSTRVRTVAVIDIGAASIRMAIAEIKPDGAIRLLETLSQAVHLGKDTFNTGEISRKTIEECVSVFRSYRHKLDEYRINRQEDIRVVATSSVREASNRITFIDRVFVATGLFIETLDEAEVHRMTYRGVQPLLKAQPALFKSRSMIIEVGGGSTEVLTLEQGNVSYSHAFRLGSLRLSQTLSSYRVPRTKARSIIEGEIHSHLEPFTELLRSESEVNMVAMGGDIRFAAEEILEESISDSGFLEISVVELTNFVNYIFSRTEDQLVNEFHLTYAEAETVGPALISNLKMAQLLGVDKVLVCNVNLRDGLIRDMAEASGAWTDDFQKQIIRATWELANKYDVDEDHARNVAELCRQLFRQLRKEHVLDDRYETLLYVAAALHETGSYINTSSMHKHSMYLIMNSTLFGITSDDLQLVAVVARYHRRSMPKITHQLYASMDRYRRVIISKLAAILRIAIALDASRSQRIRSIECRRVRNRLIISVPAVEDLSIEQIAVRRNRLFFETIFGLEVLLRNQVKPSAGVSQTSQL
ncbi:exopolyphosphatase [Planctomicrobium sp. SH668]|uniref:Ppx/GppA phosphatase family protein n=1 Tax=Planctomicrobium sp. SH668 TaxID=3448126 RepID=UPI003F5AF595